MVLLFVPAASEVSAEVKGTIYTAFSPIIFRFKLSLNTIKNKVYYDLLAATLYHFSNKKKKRFDRPDVIGVAKREGQEARTPRLKCHQ